MGWQGEPQGRVPHDQVLCLHGLHRAGAVQGPARLAQGSVGRAWPSAHPQQPRRGSSSPKVPGMQTPKEGMTQEEHLQGLEELSTLVMSLALASTFFLIFSMSDGVGTTGASHNSLQWLPALLGRQIPHAQVSKHPIWEVVAGNRVRWAQPAGSFLFALLLIVEPACLHLQLHPSSAVEIIYCSSNYEGKLWRHLDH